MHSICFAKLFVLWNGKNLDEFSLSKGLRQGDTLSPYLFVHRMEVLAQQINIAVEKGWWQFIQLNQKRGVQKFSIFSLRMI